MIGLSLFSTVSDLFASKNWAVSLGTVAMMVVFSQYLKNVPIPLPVYTPKGGFRVVKAPVFKLFPVLITILFMWGLCALLTVTDAVDEEGAVRTDLKLNVFTNSTWFRFPYPFQWGLPTVTVAGVFGMLAGVVASAIESIGDYYACARMAGAPPPPVHAMNRGIGTEGIGCILAGMWGTGNGTTSYSENIGAIGVTKVGSRRVIQWAAIIMIIFGIFCKFGAVFVTIPPPIVGGLFMVMFGLVSAVGLSNLQFVDLNSSRNLFILGFSLFFGLMMPIWVKKNEESLEVGHDVFDQVVKILLQTSMFVAGFIGFVLDNTIPGTREERGLVAWEAQFAKDSDSSDESCYDIPFVMGLIRKAKWTRLIPCLPGYEIDPLSSWLPSCFNRRDQEK